MRVINILPHGPFYELLSDSKPPLQQWNDPSGTCVAIVNREWPGQLGRWVLAQTNSFRWEVWQPDTRASETYTHVFDDGVVHRLFPAKEHIYRRGLLQPARGPYSRAILDELAELNGQPVIVVLHSFDSQFWYDILDRLGKRSDRRRGTTIFVMSHGLSITPIQYLRMSRHPLSIMACVIEQARARRYYRYIDLLSMQSTENLSAVKAIYSGRIEQIAMGCDLDFWRPVPDEQTKEAIRKRLGIPTTQRLFLAVSHFRPVKQLDRLINAFAELKGRSDLALLMVGRGDEPYNRYLRTLADSLIDGRQVIFHPYVQGEELRSLYWAADIFVSASASEGVSVVTTEAMACGLPVLTTPVGRSYEVMQRHGVGSVLPAGKYSRWPAAIREIVDHGAPPVLDREIARSEFDWRNVAAKLTTVLDDLSYQSKQSDNRPGVITG